MTPSHLPPAKLLSCSLFVAQPIQNFPLFDYFFFTFFFFFCVTAFIYSSLSLNLPSPFLCVNPLFFTFISHFRTVFPFYFTSTRFSLLRVLSLSLSLYLSLSVRARKILTNFQLYNLEPFCNFRNNALLDGKFRPFKCEFSRRVCFCHF